MKVEANGQEALPNHMIRPLYMPTQAGVQLMNDKSWLGTVGKLIYIPALYYETVEVLLYEICRIVMAQCGIENVSYTDNNLTGRISFEWQKGTLNFLSFDKYLFNQLGLITQQVELANTPLYFAPSATSGNRRASLTDVKSFYVYSDGVEYQISDNSKAMLMGVLPIKRSHGEQQSWHSNPVQAIDIPASTIPRITMTICTPTEEEVPFMCLHPCVACTTNATCYKRASSTDDLIISTI